ncbi:MAG: metalloregulator ArsR/SmtB family transcription factor [Flavobacteriales bacterium]
MRVAAHPVRLAILDVLGQKRECCVSDLQERLALEQAVLSQHLTLMRDKGLVACRRDGRFSYYRLQRPEFLRIIRHLEECCDHL